MPSASADEPSLSVFRRVGAWVDVFDYAPRLQNAGMDPRVTPDSIADMAALGVKTLYVQVANPDGAPANQLTDRAELRALLERAHEHDIAVVPWFLPRAVSPADDLATMKQIVKLRVGGESFDGIGLDLESSEVPDITLRNQRTVAFAKQVRKLVGASMPVAAIVYPAVQLEVLNTTLWPDFPYAAVNRSVDLWMPMSYYTYRDTASGLRSAYRYTVDSVDRLRKRVGDPNVPVHLIGGLAEDSTPDDYLDMTRGGAHHQRARVVGLRLRHDRFVGVAVPAGQGAGPDDAAATHDTRADDRAAHDVVDEHDHHHDAGDHDHRVQVTSPAHDDRPTPCSLPLRCQR